MSLQFTSPNVAAANNRNPANDHASSSAASDTISNPASNTSSMSSDNTVITQNANISIRTYIFFLPFPLPPNTPVPYSTGLPAINPLNLPPILFEPTSTIVLTAPSAVFVDLRFGKPTSLTPGPDAPDVLDWGFAGYSTSVPVSDNVAHSTWHHFVDSRFSVADSSLIPVDEGDMYPISATTVLEHGHAFHPQLGAVRTHEEMWTDEAVTSTTGDGKKVCVVMRAWDDEKGIRGTIVRLGKYVQGILVTGDDVSAERWEWEASGGWRRKKRVGSELVPCGVAMKEEVLVVGTKSKFGVFEWAVEGVWEF